MELRHLRYFVTLAEELHFGNAAKRLSIAQPPLSRQIQDLERELKVKLFERNRRRVMLTPAGAEFLRCVRLSFTSIDDAVRVARLIDSGEQGLIRIGLVGSSSFTSIPGLIGTFRIKNPLLAIEIRELRTPEQIDLLLADRLDVGIVRADDLKHDDLLVKVIQREPFLLALPRQHRLAKQKSVTMSELRDQPLVMYPRDQAPGLFSQVLSACRFAGFEPAMVQHATQIPVIVSFVAAGIGLALLPASVANMKWPGIVYRPIMGCQIQSVLGIAYRKDSLNSIKRRFVDHLSASVNKSR